MKFSFCYTNKWIILLLVLLFIIRINERLYAGNDKGYTNIGGLRFYSQDRTSDKRTSLNLFRGEKVITDSFRLAYDFRIYDPGKFGYVFKIIDIENQKEDAFCYFLCHPEENLVQKNLLVYFSKNNQFLKFSVPYSSREWNKFSLVCNLKNKTVKVRLNDSLLVYKLNLPEKLKIKVVFGLSNSLNSDVAAIDVRNIALKISKSEKYLWPLNDSKGNEAHEIFQNETASVENPNWLVNGHFYWEKLFEGKFDKMCGIDFDPNSQHILLVNEDSISYFNVLTSELKTNHYLRKRPFDAAHHFSIFNPKKNELISYDFHFLKSNGQKTYSIYLPQSSTWTSPESVQERIDNYHHTICWNKDTTKLIEFGGYAHYRYSKEFRLFDFDTKIWSALNLTGDPIFPRTHCCIGRNLESDIYYLYGGLGNEQGDQALGTKVFYDLYRLDLQKKELRKIWEFQNNSSSFVPRANMVIDLSDSSFYALCGNIDKEESSLSLYKFSLIHPGYEIVSDSIPVVFASPEGNAFLYYNRKYGELYGVARQTFRDKASSVVSIYKLNFPPSKGFLVNRTEKKEKSRIYIFITVLILLLSSLLIMFIRRNREHKKSPNIPVMAQNDRRKSVEARRISGLVDRETEDTILYNDMGGADLKDKVERSSSNAIWLIGKFRIFDRNGQDITHLFSAKLKNIFCILYLKTFFDNGLSNEELSDMLWPGMDKVQIKNNRGVTFNHLRKIFEELDGVSLKNEDGTWRIMTSPNVYVDLVELYLEIKSEDPDPVAITGMYVLGNLLQFEKFEEIDVFKAIFENKAVEVLSGFCEGYYSKKKYQEAVGICEIIHKNFDPFNEEILRIKIRSLTLLRQHKKAIQEYERFCQRYDKLMNTKFEISFSSINEGLT
jgi:hypothetical protein